MIKKAAAKKPAMKKAVPKKLPAKKMAAKKPAAKKVAAKKRAGSLSPTTGRSFHKIEKALEASGWAMKKRVA